VKRVQEKFGRDKFDVLLVSVDASYVGFGRDAKAGVKRMMAEHGILWPSVIDLAGWDGVTKRFGQDGYSIHLVGPDGIVRAVDIRADDLEKLVRETVRKRQ
jgi:hypothetical protein